MVLFSEKFRHFRVDLKDSFDHIRYIYLVILISTSDLLRSIEGCSGDMDCEYGHCRERLCVARWGTLCSFRTNNSCHIENNCSASANETCVYGRCWRRLPCLNSTAKTTAHTTKQNSCVTHLDCLDDELCENGSCVFNWGQGPEENNSRKKTNQVVLIVAGILGVTTLVFVVRCYYKIREVRANRRLQRRRWASTRTRSMTCSCGAAENSSYGQIYFSCSTYEQNASNQIADASNVNSLDTPAQVPSGPCERVIAITALGITPPSYEQTLQMESCQQPPPPYDEAIGSEINQ